MRLRSREAATHHELADQVGEEAAAPLWRAEPRPVEGVGNFACGIAFIAQRSDPVHELVEVAELLVGPDGTDDLVPAGEATMPVDRDTHIFAVAFDVNDDLVHQMLDDFFAIPVGGTWGVPERGEVGGECRDPSALFRRELRRPLSKESIVIVPDLPLGPQRLLPALLQGAGNEAVLWINGSVTPFCVLRLEPSTLQPLPPVLAQAGQVPADVLDRPTTQFQRGRLQRTKDLLPQ